MTRLIAGLVITWMFVLILLAVEAWAVNAIVVAGKNFIRWIKST